MTWSRARRCAGSRSRTFLRRPGGQSQFSERLAIPAGVAAPLREVLDQIVAEPAADHRLAELAKRASLSERHFRRIFLDQTGITPARFVERVRVEAARELLELTTTPIDAVAAGCGFGSPETMRRAFLRVVGVGPSDHLARFRSSSSAWPPDPERRSRPPRTSSRTTARPSAECRIARRCGSAGRRRPRCPS